MAALRYSRSLLLALALVLTVLAVLVMPGLQVETDLMQLLPRSAPAAHDMASLAGKLQPQEQLLVVLTLPEGEPEQFDLLDLGCRARDLLAESARFHEVRCAWSAQDEDFFLRWVLPRSVLHLNESRLPELAEKLTPENVAAQLTALRRDLEGVTGLLAVPFLRADPLRLDPSFMQPAMEGAAGGRLVSRDGNRTLIHATLALPVDSAGLAHTLRDLLAGVSAQLTSELHVPVQLEAIGAPFYAESYASVIRNEAVVTVTLSALAAALLLISYFGSLRLPFAVVTGVGVAVIWTGGVLAVTRGHLSFIALSMGAILVGLGVDYGIHVGNDMQRLLRKGSTPRPAMQAALQTHRKAILSSAATTFVGFGVLAFSSFGPLQELGMLIPLGIFLVLAGFYLVTLPILLGSSAGVVVSTNRMQQGLAAILDGIVRGSRRHPRIVLVFLGLLTAGLAVGVRDVGFESGFHLFRPPVPALQEVEQVLREEFDLGSGSTRILVGSTDLDLALRTTSDLTDKLRGDDSAASPLLSPSPWLMGNLLLSERQQMLASQITPATVTRLRRQFTQAQLEPAAFADFFSTLDAIAAGEPLPAVPRSDWPGWLRDLVYQDEKEAIVSLILGGDGPVEEARAENVLAGLALPEKTRAVLVSLPRAGKAIQGTLRSELRRLLVWSLLGITVTLLIAFRGRIGWMAMAMLPAGVSVIWLLGFCGWAGIPLNLFTIAVFPMLVGIGIDDGLHVAHGAIEEGSAAEATRRRAGAMTMTTLTTMIGFGSLGFSSIPAVAGGGPLIAVGIAICLLTSLLLPSALEAEFRPMFMSKQP